MATIGRALIEVHAIGPHLLGFPQLERLQIARGESIRDMNERDLRLTHQGERAHVCQDRLIIRRVLKRHEDVCVHGQRNQAPMT